MVFLERNSRTFLRYVQAKAGLVVERRVTIARSSLTAQSWHFEEQKRRTLFKKMEAAGLPLETMVSRFGAGVQSGADRLLIVEPKQATKARLERGILRRILRGRDVRRYAVAETVKLLIFPYRVEKGEFVILSESELKKRKRIYKLLCENRNALDSRIWFGKTARELSGEWYGVMYLDSYNSFSAPHILTPSLSNRANFALGRGTLFVTGTAGVTSIILNENVREDIRYLLGLLNSRLLSFYAVAHSPVFSGAYYKFSAPYLKRLPIRRIDFADRVDKATHDRIVKLVDAMLSLRKQAIAVKSSAESQVIQRQIDATDAEIDRLVYALYDLTAEEIALIEETKA
jgi:hypothetical protein